jgi:hypothetical protein
MSAECFVCASVGTTVSVSIITGTIGEPMGCCHKCQVFSCGHHALRTSSPSRYECIICVPGHIAPPPGGPGGQGAGPAGPGSSPTTGQKLLPYSDEEFARSFPTSTELLRSTVHQALEDPKAFLSGYYEDEKVLARVLEAWSKDYVSEEAMLTRLAAAIAVIQFAGIPQELVERHLRMRPDEAEAMEMRELS